jgi:hypothetical protein
MFIFYKDCFGILGWVLGTTSERGQDEVPAYFWASPLPTGESHEVAALLLFRRGLLVPNRTSEKYYE